MSDFVPWLRKLAADGGKGVVNDIDARSLGRIADEIERLRKLVDEIAREREHIHGMHQRACLEIERLRDKDDLIAEMLAALEEMVRWIPSKFAPQSQAIAMNMAEAAIRRARDQYEVTE